MHAHEHAEESHGASVGLNIGIWFGLVAITFLEVFLAYMQLPSGLMLTVLVILSVVKAGLIMSFFMHLRYEKSSLSLMLIPSMIFCICMMLLFFFPEAVRLLEMRPH